MKTSCLLTPLVLCLISGPVIAQQGALHGDAPGARQAFGSHNMILRRNVSDQSAALGPPREVVAVFDAPAFRTRATHAPEALSAGALVSDEIAAAPLVLPREFITTVGVGSDALSAKAIDDSTAYFRESAIGLGFYYGYEAPDYKLDVTARTTETTDGTTELGPGYARFPLNETREGFFGTVHAANVSYAIEITCGVSDRCITDAELQALYLSLLSCEADGNCYDIEGGLQ